jgi:caffeoyl-CoA O-methyltransferase
VPSKTDWPFVDPAIARYCAEHSEAPDELSRQLIEETATSLGPRAGMQIAAGQAGFMAMLVRLIGARHGVEIGTFTGYSALAVARALPADGTLLCCDVSEEWTSIGRRYWAAAGVADRIDLRIAPAIETLQALPQTEHFDVAFIDADKTGYAAYLEELLPRMRTNGLIMVDNTLWGGEVTRDTDTSPDTLALKAFNDSVAADPRVDCVLLPLADGLTLLRKR